MENKWINYSTYYFSNETKLIKTTFSRFKKTELLENYILWYFIPHLKQEPDSVVYPKAEPPACTIPSPLRAPECSEIVMVSSSIWTKKNQTWRNKSNNKYLLSADLTLEPVHATKRWKLSCGFQEEFIRYLRRQGIIICSQTKLKRKDNQKWMEEVNQRKQFHKNAHGNRYTALWYNGEKFLTDSITFLLS